MIHLTVKEKERIGKLLKYYRKKNKIQWKQIEKVCSTSTYSNIEKGYVSKKDEMYLDLFRLFEINYTSNDDIYEWLQDYLNRFNDILENYKEEGFDSLIDELEKELGSYKNIIIYEQYYQAITYILNYYKSSKYMTIEEIKDCFELLECFNFEEIVKVYLLEVMFISNSNKILDYEIQEKCIEHVKKLENPILLYVLGFYYKTLNSFNMGLNYFNQAELHWKTKNNNYRYIRSLIGKFIVYKNIDYVKTREMIELFIQLKDENKINSMLISIINYNIAMFYYMNCEYAKALPYFNENVEKYCSINELVFICAICTQINIKIPNVINEISLTNHPHYIYLNYFRLKYLGENKSKLSDYIFQNVIPFELNKQIYVQPFWKIFEEELLRFSNEDKRYAIKLVEFIGKKKKICKNA